MDITEEVLLFVFTIEAFDKLRQLEIEDYIKIENPSNQKTM